MLSVMQHEGETTFIERLRRRLTVGNGGAAFGAALLIWFALLLGLYLSDTPVYDGIARLLGFGATGR